MLSSQYQHYISDSASKSTFIPESISIETWAEVEPYFKSLSERTLTDSKELWQWLLDRSDLNAWLEEDMAWRYINMTCYTENKEYSKAYQDFVMNIQPQMAPVSDQLNKKVAASPFLGQLEKEPGYDIMIRNLKKEIEIFQKCIFHYIC